MSLEDSVRALLVRACGTQQVLLPGTDLLTEELLDSLAFIELLEGLEDRQCLVCVWRPGS